MEEARVPPPRLCGRFDVPIIHPPSGPMLLRKDQGLMPTKRCSRCGTAKSPSAFHKRRRSRDGLQAYCKECHRVRTEEWRDKNREFYREIARDHGLVHRTKHPEYYLSEDYLARRREHQRQYRLRYPERVKAAQLVKRAIQCGELVRPDACERCSRVVFAEASHDDYSKPLDVEWLCRQCHAAKDTRVS